ncbi:unnamed protein product [Closterium sp. NIES-53]
MASLNVLTFDAEGRAVDFEVWLDDLQLFLKCDSKDGLSLFDLTSGASTAPTADADSTVRSQWLTRDAAARLAWHDTLRTTLAALGFAPSTADPSLFLRTDATLPPFYVLVYVDDLVFATADMEALAHVKSELQKRHTCTDLGELTSYLGLRITRDRAQRTITLTQSHMVHQVLQRFSFTYSLPQSTPLPTGHSLSAPPSDESVEPSGPYPELVGCLMYLMTCTRPDVAYPLSLLARYVAPGRHRKVHWDAAKRVLRYLCSTSGMGLVLGGRARVVLTGHADASWVDDLATQRSSQGYTFSLGSGSVSWRSTCSSSELRWLTYLLTDLGEAPRSPPVLYVDNKAMLALCQEHRLEHRTKHIALRYFLARELQQRGQLRLAYVASQANAADVFSKALQPCDHQPCFAFLDWFCDLFVPLTKLLNRRGLTGVRLLLTLATTSASMLRGCTSTSTTAAATSTTTAAASTTSTAATEAPTPGATPTSTATPYSSATTPPSRSLHHLCSPCPCCCGISHSEQTQPRPPHCQRGRQQQQKQQRGEGGQGNTPQRKGCDGRREKHLQLRYSSQLQ